MKRILFFTVLTFFVAGVGVAGASLNSDRFSLKEFKKALKKDSSKRANLELAKEVVKRGVSFEYTLKRENSLREWGANETLIDAIYKSISDEGEESRLYKRFMKSHKAVAKEKRKTALQTGRLYLSRFGSNERFSENIDRVKKEIRFLECEFDPSLGC